MRASRRLPVLPEMFSSKPPAAPQVFVDGRLNIEPEAVGFDFDAFYHLAREVDYTKEQIATHTQYFSGGLRKNGPLGHHRRRTATIFVPRIIRAAKGVASQDRQAIQRYTGADVYRDTSTAGLINDIALHEFGHDYDDLYRSGKRDARVAIARQLITKATVVGMAADGVDAILTKSPTLEIAAPLAAVVVASGIVTVQEMLQGPYVNHATEGVATRFQEQYGHIRIVNFDSAVFANG